MTRPPSSTAASLTREEAIRRAIQDFDQAVKLDPNDATAFAYRGDGYMVWVHSIAP